MNRKTKVFILLFTCIVYCNCQHKTGKIIGMKIYEYAGDFNTLTLQWKKMGINTAFISTNLAANDTFRKALKKRNIKVFIIFPVFQNPDALKQDSSLYAITNRGAKAKDDWVEFVCPSRKSYRQTKTEELLSLIKKLNPDGISIDFIRQFVFWEMIYPDRDAGSINTACFCDSCLSVFSKKEGISIPDTCLTTSQKADYVLDNYAIKWDAFRCDLIAGMVKELSDAARHANPGILINTHIVPWKGDDFGGVIKHVAAQDLGKISLYADFISPMCYSQMLKRNASWISEVVTDMDKRAPGMVLPSIQVYPYYIDQTFTPADFQQCLEEALKPPSRGVVFFSWPLFEKDPSRMKIVRDLITEKSHLR